MHGIWLKRAVGALSIGLAIGGAVWFAWPRPIPVDLAPIVRGPMEVTVEDEGKTRVRHVYILSAPIAGKVLRTPRRVGDEVVADKTIVAVMQATEPGFLDVRSREELQAALGAADAAVMLAEHEVQRIETALEFARGELQRAQALSGSNVVSARGLDQARVDVTTNEHALASARAQLEVRRSERRSIDARLIDASSNAAPANPDLGVRLRAPASGRVLAIPRESEAVVQAGTPLIEIGDPRDLEVVADLLSSEAVRVEVGAPARIDGWGGPPIRGRVSRIEPAGFTKVSALGIDEQRVRAIIELLDPPEAWSKLGHDFRVTVHITQWSASNAVTVPVAALFRRAGDWVVFAVRDGRARIAVVEIGRRNNRTAEVLGGLVPGELVILHPSDRVTDGTAVTERLTR
jgi:HlyD family secretion protein